MLASSPICDVASQAVTAKPPTRTYRGSIDAMRLLAAFLVISVHLGPKSELPEMITVALQPFRVPFFVAAAFYFFAHFLRKDPNFHAFRARILTLLVPYVVWTLIYTLARFAKISATQDLVRADSLVSELPSFLLLGSSAIQLYFIPFILCGFALGYVVVKSVGSRLLRPLPLALLFVAGATVGFWTSYLPVRSAIIESAGYWGLWAVTTIPYLSAALIMTTPTFEHLVARHRHMVLLVSGLLLAAFQSVLILNPALSFRPTLVWVVANLLIAVCLCVRTRLDNVRFRPILQISFGVFLCHHLFVELFEFIDAYMGWNQLKLYTTGKFLLMLLAVFGVSAAFTMWVLRVPWLSFPLTGQRYRKSD